MSWQAQAHNDWHTLNRLEGGKGICPWDCYESEDHEAEARYQAEEWGKEAGVSIRCGKCKQTHHSVATVRFCYQTKETA